MTNAGRKRYNEEVETAKKNLSKAKSYYRKSFGSKRKDAKQRVTWAKEDLKDTKLEQKLKNQNKKSKRQEKLEEQYRKQGMPSNEAALTAYKRVRTERALAVVGTMTVAAATAYGIHKYRDNNIDRYIKGGTSLHTITKNSNKGVEHAFYASYKMGDKQKYRGLYSYELDPITFQGIYDAKINVKDSGLKLASRKTAAQALKQLMIDDTDFKRGVTEQISKLSQGQLSTKKQNFIMQKANKTLSSGKIDKNVYDAFNVLLVTHDDKQQRLNDKFYNTLRSHGYDAIKDINDNKYSGYKTKDPLIVFNGAKTYVDKISELPPEKAMKEHKIAMGRAAADYYIKSLGMYAGIGTGIHAVKKKKNMKKDNDIVSDYRKEHPNSNLSNKEIIRNYKS